MPDKTEDQKAQLVQPPIPTGSIYEAARPLSPPIAGRGPAAPAAAAAATAAAISVEPGLQDAILKLLPKWGPLVELVETLEKDADVAETAASILQQRQGELAGRLDDLADAYQQRGAALDDLRERMDSLIAVVSELREDLGVEEAQGTEEPGAEKGE